jgi:hypothetical protein
MNGQTAKMVARMEASALFSHLGDSSDLDPTKVSPARSWEDAMTHTTKARRWETVRLEASGQLRGHLAFNDRDLLDLWNPFVEEMHPVVRRHCERQVTPVLEAMGCNQDLATVSNCVTWDLLGIYLEAEFSEWARPGFYTMLAEYYVRGHWPCGWDGTVVKDIVFDDWTEKFKGKLVVY